MTPQQIRDAIAASPELQAMEPQGIADALSVGYEVGQSQEVEAWRLHRYLVKRSKWRGIVAASNDPQHPATLAAQAAITGPGAVEIDVTDLARSLAVGHGRLYVASSAEGIVRIRKRLPDDKPPNGPQYRRGKAEYDEAALRLIYGPLGFGHWGWDLPTGSADMQAFLSSH